MPNAGDHPMNKECIAAFNRIRIHDSELDAKLSLMLATQEVMKKELSSIAGNGNKGKIDLMADRINALERNEATSEVGVDAAFREVRHDIADLKVQVADNMVEMRAMIKSWTGRLFTFGGIIISAAAAAGFIASYLSG